MLIAPDRGFVVGAILSVPARLGLADHRDHGVDGTTVRAPLRGGLSGGSRVNALGRPSGDCGTKPHLCAAADGLPPGAVPMLSEAHGSTAVGELSAEVDAKPKALLGVRAYDLDECRTDPPRRDIRPAIPAHGSRTPVRYDWQLRDERNRVERPVGHLTENRGLRPAMTGRLPPNSACSAFPRSSHG